MSATDELRRLLDERGVEWMPVAWNPKRETFYHAANGVGFCADEYTDGVKIYTDATITPEQAIAATLGSEDTYTREDVEGAFVSGYSLGLDMFDSSKPDNEKGWNQNERDMDEQMEDLGWVRKDAATFGARTCREVYLLMATDIGDGREEVLGVYATESAATKAINENQFGYALHHVRKLEVTS